MCLRPCTAFQQRIAKIGTSSNEGLKYRDIEIVRFEYGKCCAHFLRGSIYIFEPVCYLALKVAFLRKYDAFVNPKRHGLFGLPDTWGGGWNPPILEKRSVTPPNFILEQQTESHMKAEVFS